MPTTTRYEHVPTPSASAPRKIEGGVFFDLYGTLLIYGDMKVAWSEWIQTLHSCLAPHGIEEDIEGLGRRCNGFFAMDEPTTPEELSILERRIWRLSEGVGLVRSTDEVRRLADSVAGLAVAYPA